MATMNQVKNGLVRYIDNEILPHLTGAKRIGLGIYTALAAESLEKTIMQYATNPAVAMLDVIDKSGNVDVAKLYKAAAPFFGDGVKQTLTIPFIGDFSFDRNDLEKLYHYINN